MKRINKSSIVFIWKHITPKKSNKHIDCILWQQNVDKYMTQRHNCYKPLGSQELHVLCLRVINLWTWSSVVTELMTLTTFTSRPGRSLTTVHCRCSMTSGCGGLAYGWSLRIITPSTIMTRLTTSTTPLGTSCFSDRWNPTLSWTPRLSSTSRGVYDYVTNVLRDNPIRWIRYRVDRRCIGCLQTFCTIKWGA